MKIFKKMLFAFFLFGSLSLSAQELSSPGFGKGILKITAKDSSFSMNFAARFQALYTSDWSRPVSTQDYSIENSSMSIRRARLKFSGFAYSPRLRYKIEIGFSNRDLSGASQYTHNAPNSILDAVLMWNFYKNFEVWAGQAKLPGNRERLVSSGDLQFVDRSLLNSYFNIDRGMGIQLQHSFRLGSNFIIKEIFAFSQGEGRNITTGNIGGHQYTLKAEILPFGNFSGKGAYSGSDLSREPSPKLAIAASYNFNQDAVKTRSNLGYYMITEHGFHQTDITSFFVDAMFKYRGFSFMGEYAQRDAEKPVAVEEDGTPTGAIVNVGNGINLQAGYLFKNNLEVSARYTRINLDKDIIGINTENQYTLGLSKFFVGHKLKLQTDISYSDWSNTPSNNIIYRLQCDIHF